MRLPDEKLAFLERFGDSDAQDMARELRERRAADGVNTRQREALAYLRRKIDGYDTTFEMADAIATNAPCHGCGKTFNEHPNDSGCQFWHSPLE